MSTITELVPLTEPLQHLDWNNSTQVERTTGKVLSGLAEDTGLLRSMVEHVPADERLCQLAEHYDILDKIVLHDDPSGWRLRLHIFLPGHFDRPHNHRWTYSSRIMLGSYEHTLYGPDDNLNERTDIAALQPYMVRTERAGTGYTLHHGMIHAAVAEPWTVTLVVRGPAMKDRFLVGDRTTGESWWQTGAAKESAEESAKKRMSPQQIAQTITHLGELAVI